MKPLNAGAERLRPSLVRETLVRAPLITPIRQRLVPKGLYAPLRRAWRDRTEAPSLGTDLAARLAPRFDDDLARLGDWLGVRLSCANFDEATRARTYEWVGVR
jgi:hypothetical protein